MTEPVQWGTVFDGVRFGLRTPRVAEAGGRIDVERGTRGGLRLVATLPTTAPAP